MILNLDKTFTPFPEQQEISFKTFQFAGGEPHIKIEEFKKNLDYVLITYRIKSFNDLGLLLVAIDALKRLEIKNIKLLLPYFPGARQDRLMVPGEALTVKVYADILNAQDLETITILDPHSEVTPALLNNCKVLSNEIFIKNVCAEIDSNIFISPDGGALKKIYKLSSFLGGVPVVECSKVRDVKTGKLSGFKVYSDDLKQASCLIVDDICDGGGTFLGLADELKKKNAGKIYLAVSHGIFSKGFSALEQKFEKIFTTNSFYSPSDSNVPIVLPFI